MRVHVLQAITGAVKPEEVFGPPIIKRHEQGCEADAACPNAGVRLRGDLFVCTEVHAATTSNKVSDTEVRCSTCGYIKPLGVPCGEPCL